jgi:hypothetical protein
MTPIPIITHKEYRTIMRSILVANVLPWSRFPQRLSAETFRMPWLGRQSHSVFS